MLRCNLRLSTWLAGLLGVWFVTVAACATDGQVRPELAVRVRTPGMVAQPVQAAERPEPTGGRLRRQTSWRDPDALGPAPVSGDKVPEGAPEPTLP
jgi:hypothetical protein